MRTSGEVHLKELDPKLSELLPVDYCLDHGVVPLGHVSLEAPSVLSVGMLKPEDRPLAEELSFRLGRQIVPVGIEAEGLRRAIGRLYGIPLDEGSGVISLDAARPSADPGLLEQVLLEAIKRGATDIHLETHSRHAEVRVRIDGVLRPLPVPVGSGNIVRLISRIKVLCGLDPTEHRLAQDGRLSVLYNEASALRRIDLRVSALPGPHGSDVAMRVLDPSRFILDLSRLEMPPGILSAFRRLSRYPHGLLLTTGPTGSGKTTTLYATLRELQDGMKKIVSVEEPVEYEFDAINQKNVTPQMGFADYLRAFLRANPDVLYVGEIRDPETAEVAVRAGTTGHLVLSTLHTRDAVSAVARLRALGVSDDFLSEVLIGVLGQRLLRRLCDACKREGPPPPELIPQYFDGIPRSAYFEPVGCELCGQTGYRGLVGVFELLEPTESLIRAVGAGLPVEELRRLALEGGWLPLVEDALHKAGTGLTSLSEVARRIPPKYRPGR
ncbi:MAG TPA: GspE/PulE family protein [Planctomycetota bacterium]|nr:GspE/PulE family protein [Planctomycetota bacterium]